MVELLPSKQEAAGSNPVPRSITPFIDQLRPRRERDSCVPCCATRPFPRWRLTAAFSPQLSGRLPAAAIYFARQKHAPSGPMQ